MMSITLHEAIAARRSCRNFSSTPIAVAAIERLLWAGYGVTNGIGKRTAPSAGALHPLQIKLLAGRIDGVASGVYAIEPDAPSWRLMDNHDFRPDLEAAAYEEQPWLGAAAAVVCLCADILAPATEFVAQAPYGMRGYKYVHIEAGAVAQNMALQAVEEQLGAVLVAGFRDEHVASILQLQPHTAPIALLCLGNPA